MKIVICDDSIEDLIKIEKLLLIYKEIYFNVDFEIEKYTDASKLYQKIQKKEMAHIYILDMVMDDKSGVDIGNQIRKMGDENVIIYVTSSEDFALDAYGVHAIRYLLKPVQKEKFFEAMDYALSYMNVKKDAVYPVKTKEGLVSVPYSSIEYIENVSRMLDICLTNGKKIKSIFIRTSFDDETREIIKNGDFLQVHKSFIINLKYVKKFNQNSMFMESGKIIPVSRKRFSDVKREYFSFISRYYR